MSFPYCTFVPFVVKGLCFYSFGKFASCSTPESVRVAKSFARLLQFFHHALNEFLRVGQILHDQLNIHYRLARPTLALAINAVLTDERHGIGDGIHGNGQAPARNAHHSFEMLQFFLLLVEYRHAPIVTAPRRGG